MSGSTPNTPDGRALWGVAAVALVAGLLQIVASVALGLTTLEKFTLAANEEPHVYLVVSCLVAAGGTCVWIARSRPAIAVTLAIAWPVAMVVGLLRHGSGLGLAYHGEFILHHFSAVLCVVVGCSLAISWAREDDLGPARFVAVVPALFGTLALGAAHLGRIPVGPAFFGAAWLSKWGAGALFLAWVAGTAAFWTRLAPTLRRPIAVVLMLPVAVRVGLVGSGGLAGELVPTQHILWVGVAIVLTALGTLVLLRPRIELWVMAIVGLICLLGSMFFYYLYENGFGELEDGLGGLLQSLFGFQVPYPPYVRDVYSAAFMMGLFFMFTTVYSALVSTEDRVRGIALGLMLIAGLGLSSPHLALMLGIGALLFLESLLPGAPYREIEASWKDGGFDPAPLDEDPELGDHQSVGETASMALRFDALSDRLGLDRPTSVPLDGGEVMVALRGEIEELEIDLRARVIAGVARLELSVGLVGRETPSFELIPDSGGRGRRPAHLIARSHKVVGEHRGLERFGDAPLDAMAALRTAQLQVWDAGARVELRPEDAQDITVDQLEALARSLIRALADEGS